MAITVDVIAHVAAGAQARDRDGAPFPFDAFAALESAGMLEPIGALGEQIAAVRAVSAADGSVGRIYDGHLNAQERLRTAAFDGRLGVWGAGSVRREGDRLHGAKDFCSGAGGLDRALVLCDGDLLEVALDEGVEVDLTWYRSAGLRASCSHRVVFDGAPVLSNAGPVGAQPWFARDACRTTATWAGLADAAFAAALTVLREKEPNDLVALAAGRMRTSLSTIDLWMAEAARSEEPSPAFAVHLRDAVSAACRALLDEAVRACGSRPLATGDALDRAKRDLDVFLLQHRLDPLVARAGHAELS